MQKGLYIIGSYINHMVQKYTRVKNIELEIILSLIRGEGHVREIARTINEPHSTVIRKLSLLMQDNAIDYKQEGKNKVFFIKKTLQGKHYVFSAERYKFIKLLRKYPELSVILEDILKLINELIILFGSYAKFSAKEDSDIDIYIKTEDQKIRHKIKELHSKVNIKTGKFDANSLLIKEIIKNHIIIKGIEEFYERSKFFE